MQEGNQRRPDGEDGSHRDATAVHKHTMGPLQDDNVMTRLLLLFTQSQRVTIIEHNPNTHLFLDAFVIINIPTSSCLLTDEMIQTMKHGINNAAALIGPSGISLSMLLCFKNTLLYKTIF